MRILSLIFAGIFTGLLIGCSSNQAKYDGYSAEFERSYSASDIGNAEKALLKFKTDVLRLKSAESDLVNYNVVLGLTDARLSVLYAYADNPKAAQVHFASATNYITQNMSKDNFTNYTMIDISNIVIYADTPLSVKWRK